MNIHEMCGVALNLLWRASWQSAVLIGCVVLLRRVMGERIPASVRCGLWLLAAARLMLPALPSAPWSVFNLIGSGAADIAPQAGAVPMRIAAALSLPAGMNRPAGGFDYSVALALVWLAGAAALASSVLWANLSFRGRVRQSAIAPADSVVQCWQSCARQLGLRHIPPIVGTPAVTHPALFGLRRGQLLVPPDFSERLSGDEARLVLLHELAHVRRRDLPAGWLMTGLRVIHWFNPMVWIASACWRADAEAACDRSVLDLLDGNGRIDYGMTLLKLATGARISAPAPALAMIDGRRQLRRRIGAIVRTQRPWRFAAAVLIAVIALFGLTDARQRARAAAATEPVRVVSITAKFFAVDPARLRGLGILNVDGAAVKLDNLDLDAFQKAAGADSIVYAPKITVKDGELAKVFVGTSMSYVADLIPTTRPDGTISYKANIGDLDYGLNWSVRPTLGNGSQVTLNMQIKLSKLKEMNAVPWHNQPNAHIQVPIIESRSIDVKISVVDGQSALLTGLDDEKKTTLIVITPKILPAKPG